MSFLGEKLLRFVARGHSQSVPMLTRAVCAVAAREREHPTHGTTQVRRKLAGPALRSTEATPRGEEKGGAATCSRSSEERRHALRNHTQANTRLLAQEVTTAARGV
jgi:hypothetical protein